MATIPRPSPFQQIPPMPRCNSGLIRSTNAVHNSSMANQDIKKESSPEESDHQRTVKHLEDIASSFINAINTRNFDPDSKPWHQIAPHFSVGSGTGARPNVTNKMDMLAGHSKLAEANPEFEIRITSFSTTVHENIGTAQVVMNAASTGVPGVPKGLWRNAVTILDFRLMDGRWLGVRECTMSGLGRMDEEWF